jgi:hypothetical protein
MPYIGRGISQLQTIDTRDAITPSTSTGAGPYNLTQSSSAFTPISANNLLISINGVVQYGNFTVSGSTVTFTGALSDSDTCNFILHVGEGVVNTPGAGTVTSSSIVDGSIVGDDINSTFDISSKTVTLPASVSGLGTGITNAQLAGSIANSKLANSSITINGSAISLGSSTTISTGTSWQSAEKTATFTAVAGEGYFVNTLAGAFEIDLPTSPSVGDEIEFVDSRRNFATANLTLDQGSNKFQGYVASSKKPVYDVAGQSIRIVYSGSTQGWIPIVDDDVTHETLPPPYTVDFLVIAGGGGGGGAQSSYGGGGGGAGGLRASYNNETSGGGGSSETALTFNTGTVYTITVGNGGAKGANNYNGTVGQDSSIAGSDITNIVSAGGGYGASGSNTGGSGGSGGGGAYNASGGSGTSGQGYNGGNGVTSGNDPKGGGGGAGSSGANGSGNDGGAGGSGRASTITGSSVTYASGGGGGTGSGGAQGGASAGGGSAAGSGNATANTGGGGGGASVSNDNAGNGGSGIVILRMPTSSYTGTTTGSPTVTTSGSDTILQFTASGTYTG